MKSFIFCFISLILVGCGEKSGTQLDSFQGEEYIALEKSDLNVSSDSIKGSGRFVFNSPLPTNSHFETTFSLLDPEYSEVTIHFYSDNQLKNGLNLTLTRRGSALFGAWSNSSFSVNLAPFFHRMEASMPIHLRIEIHHDESPAHLLIWDGSETLLSTTTALINSEEFDQGGKGFGNFWGMTLHKAELTKANMSNGMIEHDE